MGTYVYDTCVEKEENSEFYFEYLKLKLCKSCVIHYMRQNLSIYDFLKMNLELLWNFATSLYFSF